MATSSSARQQKALFVSNLEGTSMWEVSLLMSVPQVAVVLRILLAAFFDPGGRKEIQSGTWWRLSFALLDVLVIAIPSLLCLTKSELLPWLLATMLCPSLLLATVRARHPKLQLISFSGVSLDAQKELLSPRKAFLSHYRSAMMLMVIIAILAVDFTVFPRRFAKAENFGTGLMDPGPGSFVLANALVSREARGSQSGKPGGMLRSTSPLLCLGFARLLATKSTDYQVHVSEYGVHWNFFFTLAAVALLTSAVAVPPKHSGLAGATVLAGYQVALSCFGWSEYLVSAHRGSSLLSLNKEGIGSSIGYWALYLLGVQLGRYLLATSAALAKASLADELSRGAWWQWVAQVWLLDGVFWIATLVLDSYVERVSRRTCNAAYVAWMLALNLQVIVGFLLIQLCLPQRHIYLLEAFDKNLLPVFLVANVLTGLVNISVDTMAASPATAHAVLLGYIGLTAAFALTAYFKRVVLKFW